MRPIWSFTTGNASRYTATLRQVEDAFEDKQGAVIDLRRVIVEAGRSAGQKSIVCWSETYFQGRDGASGVLDYENLIDTLSEVEGPFFLTFTHTYRSPCRRQHCKCPHHEAIAQ